MALGDIGYFTDHVGGLIPGTAYSQLPYDYPMTSTPATYTRNSGNIILNEAGHYLITATAQYTGSTARFNPQAKAVTIGSGTMWTTTVSGYARDASESDAWIRVVAVLHDAQAGDIVEIQHRRDTDASTTGTIAYESSLQIVKIDYSSIAMYRDTSGGVSHAGTVPIRVNLGATDLQTGTAITRSSSLVTVAPGSKYLVLGNVSFYGSTNTVRTQRVSQLDYDGVPDLSTRSYAYMRQNTDEYAGMCMVDIIAPSISTDLCLTSCAGEGVLADQGGAEDNGVVFTEPGASGICVIELYNSTNVFKSYDSVGLQGVDSYTSLNSVRDVSVTSDNFTKYLDDQVSVNVDTNVFVFANIWAPRSNVAATTRFTGWATINDVNLGRHGNYSRGDQSTTGTYGYSLSPGGIYAYTAADRIVVKVTAFPGTEGGGSPRTQPGSVGLVAIDLNTFINIDLDTTVAISSSETDATFLVRRIEAVVNIVSSSSDTAFHFIQDPSSRVDVTSSGLDTYFKLRYLRPSSTVSIVSNNTNSALDVFKLWVNSDISISSNEDNVCFSMTKSDVVGTFYSSVDYLRDELIDMSSSVDNIGVSFTLQPPLYTNITDTALNFTASSPVSENLSYEIIINSVSVLTSSVALTSTPQLFNIPINKNILVNSAMVEIVFTAVTSAELYHLNISYSEVLNSYLDNYVQKELLIYTYTNEFTISSLVYKSVGQSFYGYSDVRLEIDFEVDTEGAELFYEFYDYRYPNTRYLGLDDYLLPAAINTRETVYIDIPEGGLAAASTLYISFSCTAGSATVYSAKIFGVNKALKEDAVPLPASYNYNKTNNKPWLAGRWKDAIWGFGVHRVLELLPFPSSRAYAYLGYVNSDSIIDEENSIERSGPIYVINTQGTNSGSDIVYQERYSTSGGANRWLFNGWYVGLGRDKVGMCLDYGYPTFLSSLYIDNKTESFSSTSRQFLLDLPAEFNSQTIEHESEFNRSVLTGRCIRKLT